MRASKKLLIGLAVLAVSVTGMQAQEVLDWSIKHPTQQSRTNITVPPLKTHLREINLDGNIALTNLYLQQDTCSNNHRSLWHSGGNVVESPDLVIKIAGITNLVINMPARLEHRIWIDKVGSRLARDYNTVRLKLRKDTIEIVKQRYPMPNLKLRQRGWSSDWSDTYNTEEWGRLEVSPTSEYGTHMGLCPPNGRTIQFIDLQTLIQYSTNRWTRNKAPWTDYNPQYTFEFEIRETRLEERTVPAPDGGWMRASVYRNTTSERRTIYSQGTAHQRVLREPAKWGGRSFGGDFSDGYMFGNDLLYPLFQNNKVTIPVSYYHPRKSGWAMVNPFVINSNSRPVDGLWEDKIVPLFKELVDIWFDHKVSPLPVISHEPGAINQIIVNPAHHRDWHVQKFRKNRPKYWWWTYSKFEGFIPENVEDEVVWSSGGIARDVVYRIKP